MDMINKGMQNESLGSQSGWATGIEIRMSRHVSERPN
jgi:hypothetical protein